MEEGKVVEESRGRRYKDGDRMVEEGEFLQSILGERIFTEEGSKEGDGTEREENWRRGLTPGEGLHSQRRKLLLGLSARGLGG